MVRNLVELYLSWICNHHVDLCIYSWALDILTYTMLNNRIFVFLSGFFFGNDNDTMSSQIFGSAPWYQE